MNSAPVPVRQYARDAKLALFGQLVSPHYQFVIHGCQIWRCECGRESCDQRYYVGPWQESTTNLSADSFGSMIALDTCAIAGSREKANG